MRPPQQSRLPRTCLGWVNPVIGAWGLVVISAQVMEKCIVYGPAVMMMHHDGPFFEFKRVMSSCSSGGVNKHVASRVLGML